MTNLHQGWRSRGYLPHYDSTKTFQLITFRLADSLPQILLKSAKESLASLPPSEYSFELRRRFDKWLDDGMGCCALQNPQMAKIMKETLQKFDGERYRLIAWCIMPNHVHVLIETKDSLAKIVRSWKSFTGRWAMSNDAQLGLRVPRKRFWMHDYWDRYVRNEDHFKQVVHYIHENPVKAKLCKNASEWRWSSANPYWNAQPQLRKIKTISPQNPLSDQPACSTNLPPNSSPIQVA